MTLPLADLLTVPLTNWSSPPNGTVPFWLLILSAMSILLAMYWNRAVFSHRPTSKVLACPGVVPLLGHLPLVVRHYHQLVHYLADNFRANGFKTFYFSLPFQPLIFFVCDWRIIEHVQKSSFENYTKGRLLKDRMEDALGDGIFNTDGHSWWLQRKAVSRIFSETAFHRCMEDVFTDKMEDLKACLDKAAASGSPVDLHSLLHCYTFDSFCKLALGMDLKCLQNLDDLSFMDAFDRMTRTLVMRFFLPCWRLVEWVLPQGRQMARDVKLIRDTFSKHVQEKLSQQTSPADSDANFLCKDLITLVIDLARHEPDSEHILSESFLVDVVINMLLAGRDTTAQAMSWGLHRLIQHPEVVEKVLAEVKTVTADTEGKLTYPQVKKLKYTNSVFLEALRLSPPVPFTPKTTGKADILPDGTRVPAGATVSMCVVAAGRNPAVWGPDAEEFRPDRWLEMAAQPSPYKYPVFHGGPRICLGRNMAQLEASYVFAELLTHYRFKVVEGHKVAPVMSLTYPMRYGLKVHVEHRKEK